MLRRLQLTLKETFAWKKGMQFVLRRKGLNTEFPSRISPDIIVEPPVRLENVIVGANVKIGKHTKMNSGFFGATLQSEGTVP